MLRYPKNSAGRLDSFACKRETRDRINNKVTSNHCMLLYAPWVSLWNIVEEFLVTNVYHITDSVFGLSFDGRAVQLFNAVFRVFRHGQSVCLN